MSERARALADRFEHANHELIATVEACSDAAWRAKTTGEDWTVGVVAHHVAEAHRAISGLVELRAKGQPLPNVTMDMIHQGNAAHAKQQANCTKAETLALLRQNGSAALGIVRGLSDAQLDGSAPVLGGAPMTLQQVIERILIGHVQDHHSSIRTAIAAHTR
jgi:hypothetical protein